ncbi:glycosyltransferase [Marivirga sp.]|uniref:glycosyltransferase n=1 Tax=Marivirga sp. TaxID=2018662 RepID=UPI002D7ECA7F|nr:glycosyltransferase [Marivirga sp.]HET8860557.1 glycosyltransferase [Marivirga sp.]
MISIIIPTFNRAKVISKSIESVINQTYSDWELIIVDDGSTDNTSDVILPYLKNDRIIYIKQENKGVCAARNYGAEHASLDYLLFLDSDDEILTECLEEHVMKLEKSKQKIDIQISGITKVDQKGNTILLPEEKHELFPDYKSLLLCGAFIINLKTFQKLGGYNTNLKYSENTELGIRLYLNKPIHSVIDRTLAVYYKNDKNPNRDIKERTRSLLFLLNTYKILYKQRKLIYCKYLVLLGRFLIDLNKISAAKKILIKALRINPINPKIYYAFFKTVFSI